MRSLLNEVCGRLDILEAHVLGAGDVYQHAVCAVYRGLHERACDCHAGCILRLALACRAAYAHMGEACVFHDAGDIGKVKVYKAGVLDKIRDAGNCLTENIVGYLKRVCEGDLLIGRVFQAVVGDYQQRIDLAEHFLNALIRLIHAALALKFEGLRDNADGEYSGLARNIRNCGSSTCTRAAAHTGSDEHHVGILNGLGDIIAAFLGALLTDLGIGACALTVSQLFADLDLLIRAGHGESLLIGVYCNELNALSSGLNHSIYDIVAGTADTDDLYSYDVFRAYFGFEIHFVSSSTVI